MKLKTILVVGLLSFMLALNANAYTVEIHLDGIEESGVNLFGFQYGLLDIDNDEYDLPLWEETYGSLFNKTTLNDFTITVGSAWLYPDYWELTTTIRTVDSSNPDNTNDDPTKDLFTGAFSFPEYGYEDFLNTLADGLLLAMESTETNFKVDTSSFLFWVYDSTDPTNWIQIYDFTISEEIDTDNDKIVVTVDFNPTVVPVPSSLFLLCAGICFLFRIKK